MEDNQREGNRLTADLQGKPLHMLAANQAASIGIMALSGMQDMLPERLLHYDQVIGSYFPSEAEGIIAASNPEFVKKYDGLVAAYSRSMEDPVKNAEAIARVSTELVELCNGNQNYEPGKGKREETGKYFRSTTRKDNDNVTIEGNDLDGIIIG